LAHRRKTPEKGSEQMEQSEFLKQGKRAPFVKWTEPGVEYEGVVLSTRLAPDYVFGTRELKLDDDGNEVKQLLVCIDGDDSQWMIPVRFGSNLHSRLANAIEEKGCDTVEPGGSTGAVHRTAPG
jgi:hypothetical protein